MRFWFAAGFSLVCACSSTGESEKPSRAPDSGRELAAAGGEPDARTPLDAGSGEPPVDAGGKDAEPPRAMPEAGSSQPQPQPAGASAPEAGPVHDERVRVRGKVIDFWRQPVAGVEVTIGETTARTDATGAFTIERVTPPYAALAVFSVTYPSSNTREYRWLYEGLTRADPTLQVDSSNVSHAARVEATFTGPMFPLPAAQRLQYAFGSPHTMWNRE